MLHIFLARTPSFGWVPENTKLVFGETVSYYVDRAVKDFIKTYRCGNEPYTYGVINENYYIHETMEVTRLLFNSSAINKNSDVLFVWDDVLAISAEYIYRFIYAHRQLGNTSTWIYQQGYDAYPFRPLIMAAKGKNFKKALLYSEKRYNQYKDYNIWLRLKPKGIFKPEEQLKHIFSNGREGDWTDDIKAVRERLVEKYTQKLVTFTNSDTVYISPRTSIGRGTVIYHNVTIEGDTKIGDYCTIGPNVTLRNVKVGSHVTLACQNLHNTKIPPTEPNSVPTQLCQSDFTKTLTQDEIEKYTRKAITFTDSDTVFISKYACIGKGVIIHHNVSIENFTIIGRECTIGPNVMIGNGKTNHIAGSEPITPHPRIGWKTIIQHNVSIEGCTEIGDQCIIGPNVTLRNVKIGDNVMLKEQCLYDTEIPAAK